MSTPSETPTRWDIVLAAFGAGVIGAAHIGKVPSALPEIRDELSLGLVAAGWVVSVFSATGMAFGIVAGLLSDRIGHRRVIVGALVLLAASSAVGAFAENGGVLLATRFIEGLAFLVIVVSAPSIISEASATVDRRLAVGMWGAFMPAGMAIMLGAAPMIQSAYGWRGSWLVMAVVTLAWAGVMLATYRRGAALARQPQPEAVWRNLSLTVAARGPWLLATCFSFYTLSWMALMVWLPTFGVEQRGLSLATASGLTMLAVAMNFPGNLVGGWLLHKGVGSGGVCAIGALAMIAAGPLIFLDFLPDIPRYLACLAFSFTAALVPAGVLGGAPWFSPSPRQIAATNGLIVQGSHTGQLIGPPLIAALVGMFGGWQVGAGLFIGCGVGIAVFAGLIAWHERRRRDQARDRLR